jgi:OmpA-OmpF porin, OOP family
MTKQLIAALAALTVSAVASAQGYGVVSAGVSRLNADCTGTTSCDKSDTAFKLLGGYKFMPNLAAELGYFSFGKAKASDGAIDVEIKNTGFGGGVAFHQDVAPNWPFVARLGLAQMKTKISAAAGGGSGSDSDNNIALYGGLGIGYKIAKSVSIDASWDFSKSKYNKNGVDESGSLNAISVGLTFGF